MLDNPILDWRTRLADTLRIARGAESQNSLGARARVSDRTISMIEVGRLASPPRLETIARLAIATGSNPHEWLALLGRQVSPAQLDVLRRTIGVDPSGGASLLAQVETVLAEHRRQILLLKSRLDELSARLRPAVHPRQARENARSTKAIARVRRFARASGAFRLSDYKETPPA